MSDRLTFLALAGDGIGPEIMTATLQVLDALGPILSRPVEVQERDIGFAALSASGVTITDEVITEAKKADGILLGPVSHNAYPAIEKGGVNPSGILRKQLSLYANIRPAKSYEAVDTPIAKPIDLVVMRENLEGFYADRNMAQGAGEFMPVDGVALSMRRITTKASHDIAKAAFALADTRHKKHITAIHKANVMRLSDGLFLEAVRDIAASYPHISYDEMLVDSAAAMMVRTPERFDVLVTTNMFGDILSDLASELAGGLGLAGSLNVGHDHALAQAQHGSAPDIAGTNTANPTSLILSLAMLLRHLGEEEASLVTENAITTLLKQPNSRTQDLGGTATCSAFTDQLIQIISQIISA